MPYLRRRKSLPKQRNKVIHAGWRTIGLIPHYYRSRWEANYARLLEWYRTKGIIRSWEHEPETFWFESIKRGVRSYLPDFRIMLPDGSIEYHEVKGFMDTKSATKLKRMAKYYPTIKVVLIDEKQYLAISKSSALILGWEN